MQGVEFNHAISFVNKIKNRYDNDPETYKQFLEVLQTYQRDQREIAEVSANSIEDALLLLIAHLPRKLTFRSMLK